MRLETVYARFYRSLNYDYLRKFDPGYEPDPWDTTPRGANYPFVRVRLEPDITTVVGANESGKSQLLTAIKLGLTGKDIDRGDFCRYSPFFSTEKALVRPEFGLLFCELGDDAMRVIAEMCALDETPTATKAALFRMNGAPKLRLYLRSVDGWTMHPVRKSTLLRTFGLPDPFEIDSAIPLPDTVPLEYLATATDGNSGAKPRQLDLIRQNFDLWFSSTEVLSSSAATIVAALSDAGDVPEDDMKMYDLAADLLLGVSGLERELFEELLRAVAAERNGYARGIIDTVNRELASALNFPHWWSQDTNFELFVDLRGFDLAFMIRDRTGTTYSFDERSAGLKYFLSYFVQYLAHDPPDDGQEEILLMDEPDAYLSSSGQQDLLRIFAAFAHPTEPHRRPIQVVYVTHSPFLIDKNHAERIRVLEKGQHDEGTRVVANASRNHYEPLRSALGSFVGETAFISTCNLLLEGPSDQILVAGMTSRLGKHGAAAIERLDLNEVTLVPASSASQVPYLAFLARGRDVDKPAIIVLLDGDPAGNQARADLARGGPRRKQLVAEQFILQLSDDEVSGMVTANPAGPCGIEDLVPESICLRAVQRYCEEFIPDVDVSGFAADSALVFKDGCDTAKGLERAARRHAGDETLHLDKIGFARSVLQVIDGSESISDEDLAQLDGNFRILLRELARRQRAADREASQEKIRNRINRVRRRFEADHPDEAHREEVLLLIEEIEHQLDTSAEAEEVRAAMRQWIARFHLDDDPRAPLDDHAAFLEALRGVAYVGALAVQETISL